MTKEAGVFAYGHAMVRTAAAVVIGIILFNGPARSERIPQITRPVIVILLSVVYSCSIMATYLL